MSQHKHDHSGDDLRCDAITQTSDVARRTCTHDIDPAIIIGLALGHARQGGNDSRSIPAPVMARLDALADHGDTTCHLVRNWISGRMNPPIEAFGLMRRRSPDGGVTAENTSAAFPSEVL
ncbi:hypothetical protein [Rhizobium halophilum]|uniref:hypothetical protein n=1 Tax=Rhizobium halophilum TaxID=2846852 RepID=UPI001EFCD30B|nr:hypothetical protein [Rhizobium halophilum]MCF6368136.1 hypothetical protein [Rhizobium halophilum]